MARLTVDTWFAAHASQVSAEVLQKRREEWGYGESEQGWLRAIRQADGRTSIVLVATDRDQIIAVASAEMSAADCAEVGALYVAIPRQRSGVGRMLLESIIEHYRRSGVPMLQIAVLDANQPARRFYERLGGVLAGNRSHEDGLEVVYAWALPEAGGGRGEHS